MTEDPIIYLATVNKTGNIDIQCRPSAMTLDGYALVMASMVHATVNMFVAAGAPPKDALDAILKRLVREARKPTASATYSSQHLQ